MFKEIPASKMSTSRRRLVHGVGINDAKYIINPLINGEMTRCQFYSRWNKMITRCYSLKFQERNPTYIGCSACPEWLIFSNFKSWMEKQDWENKELDKDIISPGNKIYSPENCAFVPKPLNGLIVDQATSRGKYPRGVYFNELRGNICSNISYQGVSTHIGTFSTTKEASRAYIKAKVEIILAAVDEQQDIRVANGLKLHADLLLRDII
jgi:hypothetical protein